MKFDLGLIFTEPKYAACLGGVIGLLAKYIENRMTTTTKSEKTTSNFMGYVKSVLYSAGLAGLIVYLKNKFGGGAGFRSESPISSPYRSRGGGYSSGGGGGYDAAYGGSGRIYGTSGYSAGGSSSMAH